MRWINRARAQPSDGATPRGRRAPSSSFHSSGPPLLLTPFHFSCTCDDPARRPCPLPQTRTRKRNTRGERERERAFGEARGGKTGYRERTNFCPLSRARAHKKQDGPRRARPRPPRGRAPARRARGGRPAHPPTEAPAARARPWPNRADAAAPVSYTHLTLPTKLL
jgi:hypothetical protein